MIRRRARRIGLCVAAAGLALTCWSGPAMAVPGEHPPHPGKPGMPVSPVDPAEDTTPPARGPGLANALGNYHRPG